MKKKVTYIKQKNIERYLKIKLKIKKKDKIKKKKRKKDEFPSFCMLVGSFILTCLRTSSKTSEYL